jgi:hypothetical protein
MFNCELSYLICELIQLFDPPYIAERTITTGLVARLAEINPFGKSPDLMAALQRDLPANVAATSGFSISHGDVGDFTEGILGWWKSHASEVESRARLFFAQNPLREQPGHCPRRLDSRIDDAPLQQHRAR